MEIKPIKSEADYAARLLEIEALMDAKAGTPRGDRLDVLVTLVEAYDAQHHPIEPPTAIEAIKFRMEQEGLTRRDLEPMIGSKGRVADILNGRRSLTIPMIRKLNRGLKIPAESLIWDERHRASDYGTPRAARRFGGARKVAR
jgi:HTH-type transcriptional regulator/antitoxin HigA